MMRVIVEIHPDGDASRKREVASIDIANMSELASLSNYDVAARFDTGARLEFPLIGHRRVEGWLPLVQRVLNRCAMSFGLPETPSGGPGEQ